MNPEDPRRHALLIGINQYSYFSEQSQLKGCVNDVELMTDVLSETFRFPHIRRLCDQEATREGILSAMNALVREVKDDDVVVFFYSGHGSQVFNKHGWSPDGFDETIVPHDSGRGKDENRDVRDREIEEWLFELTAKTAYVTLIFDSCHAGSITRDPLDARVRRIPRDPPLRKPRPGGDAGRRRGPSGWLPRRPPGKRGGDPLGDRYVLLAACRSHEPACELKYNEAGRPQGALTFHLCQELSRAHPRESYRDLFERLAPRVTADYPEQHPQLEGAWDRELFGSRSFEPMRFVPVRERTDGRVTLAAGAAHGLTAGSEWAVYGPGTRRAEVGSEAELGRVRVLDDVDPVAARAEMLPGERADEITAGCRAVVVVHDHGEMCWTVGIRGSLSSRCREALERRIGKSLVLRLAPDGQPVRAWIHFLTPRHPVGVGDPAPQAGAIDEPSWAVVKSAGDLLLGPRPASYPLDELVQDLERCARYELALRLIQPDDLNELYGLVEVTLFRRSPGGVWARAEPSRNDEVVFEEGDLLGLQVTNRSEQPIYLSVLDFGLTHGVSLLYPVRGACKPLAPGRVFEIGMRRNDEIEVFLPAGFSAEEGTEYLKLFATTAEADFSSLTQRGVRTKTGDESQLHPLEQLLRKTLTGYGRRDARRVPTSDWTTVCRQFVLRRPPGSRA
ncbi:MAG: caspase family protein [bacterium]|nr:caspase family protein [bacterium]